MNIFLLIYLVGVVLKTFMIMLSLDEDSTASEKFNYAILWPWYFVLDVFFGIMSVFSD